LIINININLINKVMKTSKSYCRFEKAAVNENLSDFIAPSFLAHVNRVGKQERKGISKFPKFPKKEVNN